MANTQHEVYWDSYSNHLGAMLQELRRTEELSDVTLFCDDKTQFRVHKVILATSSPVLKTIVNELPSTNSVIYLRGIKNEEMEAILDYIYLGAVTVEQNKIDGFLQFARSLELNVGEQQFSTSTSEDDEKDDVERSPGDNWEVSQDLEITDVSGNVEFPVDNTNNDEDDDEIVLDEMEEGMQPVDEFNYETDESVTPVEDSKQCPATECNKVFATTQTMIAHYQKRHKDNNIYCNQCNYKTSTKQNLRLHIQSKHEGITYDCNQCDYKASQPANLRLHMQAKHEGITYDCNQCDYKASQRHWLKNHIETRHNGLKFCCDKCDYVAAFQSSLYNHVQSKHDGVKYPCTLCGYQLNSKNTLVKHKKYKHEGLC